MVDPATYALAGGPGVGTITIITTAHGTAKVGNTSNRNLSGWPFYALALFTTPLLAMTLATLQSGRRLSGTSVLSLLFLALLALGLVGCSGSSGSSCGGSQNTTGTPNWSVRLDEPHSLIHVDRAVR